MGDIRFLTFPNKSHRKKVILPIQSIKLAEFMGIMMGDGGINNKWQINIALNSIADQFYIAYVSRLLEELFGIKSSSFVHKTKKVIHIFLSSVTVVDFLIANGLFKGDKLKAGLMIPKWIMDNVEYKKWCTRGLIDTDGCLYIHKHAINGKTYANIGLCFTSFSPPLIENVALIFEEFGIIPHISNKGRSIYLYKADAVARYLVVFGSSNERILSVYNKWRRG